MKRLLRDRKSSLSSKSKPVIVSGPTALSATPPTETPLYARFASSQQRQDGHNKPVVSGPAGLSSKTSFSRGTSSAGRQHGQEGHSNVLRRKQSRQEQVQSTPQVISSPPARSSSRVAPHLSSSPPKQSSYAQGHEPRQGQPLYSQSTEATASSSRTPLHARTQSGPLYSINPSQTTFPQMQSSESWRDRTQPTLPQAGLSGLQVSEMTDKMDSFDSDSELQPPRFLVVRNGDPETSSTTSRSSSVPRDPAPPVNERTPTKVRPTSQYSPQSTTPLDRAGFTLHDHGIQPLPSHVSATQAPRSEPISTASPSWTQYPNTASNAASYTPSRQAPQPDIAQTESPSFPMASSSSSPSFQSQRKPAPSLLATPSFTRKKYSPLAAFGLPVSANTSMTTSSSMQGEPAQSDVAGTPLPAPQEFLPTPDTPEVLESHHLPAIPPQAEQTPEIPSTSIPPSAPSSESPRSTPPPSPPRPVSQRLSIPQPRDPSPQRSANPTEFIGADQTGKAHTPEPEPPLVFRPHPVPIQPTMGRSKPRESRHRDRENAPDRLPTSSSKEPKSPRGQDIMNAPTQPPDHSNIPLSSSTPPTQLGPVRGKPLIFTAMTATSEVEDIEPQMVEMIGSASVEAKTAEGYSAYAYGGQQTSTPPPEPIPEPARAPSPQRRKLSKSRAHSSRKAPEALPAAEVQDRRRHSGMPSSQPIEQPAPPRHTSRRESNLPTEARSRESESSSRSREPESSSRSREPEPSSRYGSPAESSSQRKSASQHDSGKLQKRSRDGVKILTDKQMEKLSNRKSYHSSAVPQDPRPSVQPSRQSYVEESASIRPLSQHQSGHRVSQAYAAPPPAPAPHYSPQPSHKHLQNQPRQAPPVQIPPGQWPEQAQKASTPVQLPTPPEEYAPVQQQKAEHISPRNIEEMEVFAGRARPKSHVPLYYPLQRHLADSVLLENLLGYLSYYDWLILTTVSKEVRRVLHEDGREQVLARYLQTVGYNTWLWKDPEPLILTVDDLCHYMRGVSIPVHRYAAMAHGWLQRSPAVEPRIMQELTFASRAFTRVVMRLRAQAEAEAAHYARTAAYEPPSPVSMPGSRARTTSISSQRHPAKWSSQTSLNGSRAPSRAPSPASQTREKPHSPVKTFHSPMFRLRRAPLLQVFVPSPEGDWLSDTSVLECEAELKRAGVLHLLRAGDVVWDVAVGDEANVGRLVWDGAYLIDLDYTYSRVGDPPRYLPTLAFPPSYFHRVIRTMGTGNPVVRIDLSPWADQIKANLQLLQDKLRMDTPQGGRHTVVRWVHRSSFVVRPPAGSKSIRLPMPHTAGPGPSPTGAWIVDPDWFGTVVVETEGTNEGLAELQARCKGPLIPRRGQQLTPEQQRFEERRMVFRILREKSRPGEIWVRIVSDKERIIL